MNSTPAWTTPTDVTHQLNQYWDRGHILSARVNGAPLFPLTLRIKRPDPKALGERFDDVRQWIRALEEGSKPKRGFGYEIGWGETQHRQIGSNRVPTTIQVPTEDDALRLIGKQRQAERFQRIIDTTVQEFPELRTWLARRPLLALESADEWSRILAVLTWFREHPRCGRYLRQLDIPGVDTKFIETRKGLLSELLDLVLPAQAIDTTQTGARQFESRYGLRDKPVCVRFRVLDQHRTLYGLSDLTVDIAEFARLSLDIRRVFITENDTNGLAFPQTPESIVIFGGGYGVNLLAAVPWLAEKTLFYWGDLDTHGFSMLSRLRHIFPHAHSLLMDSETLLSHRHLWVQEDKDKRCLGALQRLTEAEQQVYDDLRYDRFGDRIRLEQERIAFRRVEEVLG